MNPCGMFSVHVKPIDSLFQGLDPTDLNPMNYPLHVVFNPVSMAPRNLDPLVERTLHIIYVYMFTTKMLFFWGVIVQTFPQEGSSQ